MSNFAGYPERIVRPGANAAVQPPELSRYLSNISLVQKWPSAARSAEARQQVDVKSQPEVVTGRLKGGHRIDLGLPVAVSSLSTTRTPAHETGRSR